MSKNQLARAVLIGSAFPYFWEVLILVLLWSAWEKNHKYNIIIRALRSQSKCRLHLLMKKIVKHF